MFWLIAPIIGAEKIAPPGIGRKPINAGNVTSAIRLSPTSFLNESTIRSNLPEMDIPLDKVKIPVTIITRDMVSTEKIPAIAALKRLGGVIRKKIAKNTLPIRSEKLR